jgi:2-iminobutanoate/2-iminopropanoate deaminase
MSRTGFTADGAVAVGPYSHAVEHGGFVYLSGQTPMKPGTRTLVEGTVQIQTQQCFDNLRAVLTAAALTMDDVIKCHVFLVDMGDFAAMNEVYERQFAAPFPARTTIGVASLPMGAAIEIDLVAARPITSRETKALGEIRASRRRRATP